MTAQTDPYVRVYYRIIEDDKFSTVYDDDHRLAAWLRLLLTADAMYPAPAPVPYKVNRRTLHELESCGLIELLPGHRYRVHGMAAERDRQSAKGKAGAAARWNAGQEADAMRSHSEGNAPTASDAMHSAPSSPSAPLPSAPSNARPAMPPGFDEDPEWRAIQWLTAHGCYIPPTNGFYRNVVTTVERHGVDAVISWFEKCRRAGIEDGDTKGFVFGAVDGLRGERPSTKRVREVAEGDADRERAKHVIARTAAEIDRLAATPAVPDDVAKAGFQAMKEAISNAR